MKLLLIYNPVSGKSNNRDSRLGKEILELGKEGYDVMVHRIKEKGEGAKYINENDISAYDLVAVQGGDGTLHEIVDGMLKLKEDLRKPIAYLPAGSTNDYAKNLGITQANAIKNIFNNDIRTLDVGVFNGEHFNYVAGFGFFTDIPYSTPQNIKNSLGYLAYVLEGAKELTEMKAYRLRCETDSAIIEDDILIGIITNTLSVGGMKLKEDIAKLDDGILEYIFIKYPQNLFEIQNIIFLLMNSKFDHRYMYYGQSKSFKIESEPMSWTLDGEDGGNVSSAEIHVCEKVLNIVVGDNN